ncbi:MAG: hypothetical protein FJW14_00840 [Acidimicrobiia bacterium]|nr:hypothetical protein [Acidimicrobiia bacterium]
MATTAATHRLAFMNEVYGGSDPMTRIDSWGLTLPHAQESCELIYQILANRAGKPLAKIIRDTKRTDLYLDAKKALEYGLIDAVVDAQAASRAVLNSSKRRATLPATEWSVGAQPMACARRLRTIWFIASASATGPIFARASSSGTLRMSAGVFAFLAIASTMSATRSSASSVA